MHYNVRLIEYPNGNIQIRHYSNLLFIPDLSAEQKQKNAELRFDEQFKTLDPFTKSINKVVFDFDDYKKNQIANKFRSCNRTKQAVFTYGRCAMWKYFITLTLDEKKIDRYDYDKCSNSVRSWLKNMQQRFAPNLQYLVVPEQHKDGAWHFHGLFANTADIKLVDSGLFVPFTKNIIYNIFRTLYKKYYK